MTSPSLNSRSIGRNIVFQMAGPSLAANQLRQLPTMAIPLEEFIKQLEDSGILAGDMIEESRLTRRLVRKK